MREQTVTPVYVVIVIPPSNPQHTNRHHFHFISYCLLSINSLYYCLLCFIQVGGNPLVPVHAFDDFSFFRFHCFQHICSNQQTYCRIQVWDLHTVYIRPSLNVLLMYNVALNNRYSLFAKTLHATLCSCSSSGSSRLHFSCFMNKCWGVFFSIKRQIKVCSN